MVYRSALEASQLTGDELLGEIERRKARGGEHYARSDLNASLQAWLSAIWLLKQHRPPYPSELSAQTPPTDERAALLLGRGRAASETPPDAPPPPKPAARSLPFLGGGVVCVLWANTLCLCAAGSAAALLSARAAAGVMATFFVAQVFVKHQASFLPLLTDGCLPLPRHRRECTLSTTSVGEDPAIRDKLLCG